MNSKENHPYYKKCRWFQQGDREPYKNEFDSTCNNTFVKTNQDEIPKICPFCNYEVIIFNYEDYSY